MKKLMIAGAVMLLTVAANAGCWWSWWVGDDKAGQSLQGCQLGVAAECKEIKGAQVAILWDRTGRVQNGAQVALGYTNCGVLQNGAQVAVVNIAREGSALQLGLLNFNKAGFLPFFPFFNFSTKYFGGGRK